MTPKNEISSVNFKLKSTAKFLGLLHRYISMLSEYIRDVRDGDGFYDWLPVEEPGNGQNPYFWILGIQHIGPIFVSARGNG